VNLTHSDDDSWHRARRRWHDRHSLGHFPRQVPDERKRTSSLSDTANYSCIEPLRDGRRMEIRALRPDDRDELLAAVKRIAAPSLYRRFFGVKRNFTETEIAFFLNIDFIDHVALVAVVDEGGQPTIVGGARYVTVEPGKAELAFAVIDQYQNQGIGAALMHHLGKIARDAGLAELVAEVLPENLPMLKVFEKSGYCSSMKREARVIHVRLQLPQEGPVGAAR
jgi:RimJ/RimL family protein N-acetyltransferase